MSVIVLSGGFGTWADGRGCPRVMRRLALMAEEENITYASILNLIAHHVNKISQHVMHKVYFVGYNVIMN